MANVLSRTTKQYIKSVHTPNYPISDWIYSPDLSAITGFSSIYWTITGDSVTLMSESERNTVDEGRAAQALELERTEQKNRVDSEKLIRAMAVVIMNEINLLRSEHSLASRSISQFRTAIKNQIGQE